MCRRVYHALYEAVSEFKGEEGDERFELDCQLEACAFLALSSLFSSLRLSLRCSALCVLRVSATSTTSTADSTTANTANPPTLLVAHAHSTTLESRHTLSLRPTLVAGQRQRRHDPHVRTLLRTPSHSFQCVVASRSECPHAPSTPRSCRTPRARVRVANDARCTNHDLTPRRITNDAHSLAHSPPRGRRLAPRLVRLGPPEPRTPQPGPPPPRSRPCQARVRPRQGGVECEGGQGNWEDAEEG